MNNSILVRNVLVVISLICAIIIIYCTISKHKSPKEEFHTHIVNTTRTARTSTILTKKAIEDDSMNISSEMEDDNSSVQITAIESFRRHKNFKLFNKEFCGNKIATNKISAGHKTKILDNPWMVALGYLNKTTNETSIDCAGSLISENLVLTAAHCVYPRKPYLVRLGDYNIKTDPDCTTNGFGETICADKVQEITEIKILKYQYYHYRGFEDIALIKLNTPANLQHNNIDTICLPFEHEFPTVKNYYVTGWGRIYNNATFSDVLMGAFVPYVTHEECRKYIKATLTKGHICAGGDGKDSCKGDSGGPLTHPLYYERRVRNYQFGIVSYGPITGCGTAPGVYTKVYTYLRWILDNADF